MIGRQDQLENMYQGQHFLHNRFQRVSRNQKTRVEVYTYAIISSLNKSSPSSSSSSSPFSLPIRLTSASSSATSCSSPKSENGMGGEDGGREEGGKEDGGGEERNPDGPAVGDLERERGRLGLCWEEGGMGGEGCYMLAVEGRAGAGCSPWE